MQHNWKNQLSELKSKAKQITDNSFSTGKVLRMALNEDDGIVLKDNAKERHKYFSVIGQDKDRGLVGSLLVNSNINQNVINTKELQDCQFPLRKKDYGFLSYDSYLDCLGKNKIMRTGTEEGELTQNDKALVLDHLRDSEIISAKLKKRYNIISG
jgi:hypothetical protein